MTKRARRGGGERARAAPRKAVRPGAAGGRGGTRGLAVSVIVPVLDQLAYTRLCLGSLFANTPGGRLEVVVVDSGSGDETRAYLAGLAAPAAGEESTGRGGAAAADGSAGSAAGVRVVELGSNQGIAAAWNAGVQRATNPCLVFADNDVLFPPGWLDGLLRGFTDDDVWAVVPMLSRGFVPRDVGDRTLDLAGEPVMASDGYLIGSLFALKRKTFHRVGPFDEALGIGPYADLDYDFRIRTAEKRVVTCFNVCVHHFEGRTVMDIPGFLTTLEERNRRYLEQKWRMDRPLPPMSDDFEYGLWVQQARELPEPDPEEVARRNRRHEPAVPGAAADGAVGAPPRIIACLNVFNERDLLPDCLAALDGADLICVVDGPYAAFEHEQPRSTDGTVEYLEELAGADERIRLMTSDEPWRDQAAKRSAYLIGEEGDWYLIVDADERLEVADGTGDAVAVIREHLVGCTVEYHSLVVAEEGSSLRRLFPRLIRHQPGLRYDAAHWNLVADAGLIAPSWATHVPLERVRIRHVRGSRPLERRKKGEAFYGKAHAAEAYALETRIRELEDAAGVRREGGGGPDAAEAEMLRAYQVAALHNRLAHEMRGG